MVDAEAQAGDQLGLLVGAQEEIDGRISARQAGHVVGAHGAAREHHPQRRVGRLEALEGAHPADDLLLGGLADGARVDDHQVGGLQRGGLGAARRQQGARHLLRVAAVHLAAERPDVEARQDQVVGRELGHAASGARTAARAAVGRVRTAGVDDRQLADRHRSRPGLVEGGEERGFDRVGHAQPDGRLGVGHLVAMVVAAPRGHEPAGLPRRRPSP